MLCDHPEIDWPAGVKETFFFDQRFKKGWDWYYWHFKNRDRKLIGEIGPTYFENGEAANRVKQHAPQCKIIIGVRNPIEKTYSVFRHYHSLGELPSDFDRAIQQSPRLIECGHYQDHCQTWIDLFGRDNVMLLLHDDIIQEPQRCLLQVTEFLGISASEVSNPDRVVNSGGTPFSPTLVRTLEIFARSLRSLRMHRIVNFGKKLGLKKLYSGGKALPKLTQQQRNFLTTTFAEDIKWLEQYLGRDLSHWLTKKPK